jgi:hypothetical protein
MKIIATKLRNANITKVDLVDEGANQGAAIKLFKSKAGPEAGAGKRGDESNVNWVEKIGKAIGEAMKSVFGEVSDEIVQKAAIMFNRAKQQTKVSSLFDRNWWDYTSALRKSIESILTDDTLEDTEKETKVGQSLKEFGSAVTALLFDTDFQAEIAKTGRKIAAERLSRMKEAHQTLAAIIAEVESETDDDQMGLGKSRQNAKEEIDTMKIDKSKMTADERAQFEALEKKYGTDDGGTGTGTGADPGAGAGTTQSTPSASDAVTKALETANTTITNLTKRLDEMQEKTDMAELTQVAKKYEVCGEKPEELAKTLYALKKANNQAAYDSLIATLDKAAVLVEKSGLFREIGRSGQGGGTGDAWDQIVTKAQEIRKSKPELSEEQAIDEVCKQHPELVKDYETNR